MVESRAACGELLASQAFPRDVLATATRADVTLPLPGPRTLNSVPESIDIAASTAAMQTSRAPGGAMSDRCNHVSHAATQGAPAADGRHRAAQSSPGDPAGRVFDTRLVTSQLMQPIDANFMGVIHGGAVVKLIDEVAAACAYRFCRQRVVTASIDRLDFHRPVAIGSLLILKSTINHAGNTSVEVGVRVETENLSSGEMAHTNSAHLVLVAVDHFGKPTRVPRLTPETEEEKRRWKEAEARQAHRRSLREAAC